MEAHAPGLAGPSLVMPRAAPYITRPCFGWAGGVGGDQEGGFEGGCNKSGEASSLACCLLGWSPCWGVHPPCLSEENVGGIHEVHLGHGAPRHMRRPASLAGRGHAHGGLRLSGWLSQTAPSRVWRRRRRHDWRMHDRNAAGTPFFSNEEARMLLAECQHNERQKHPEPSCTKPITAPTLPTGPWTHHVTN